MKRMNNTAKRTALPVSQNPRIARIHTEQIIHTFNGDAVIDLIKQLIRLDKHWIPDKEGYSLYIRPTFSTYFEDICDDSHNSSLIRIVGTQAALGIAPPSEALLFVICSPVGPYYPQGFKPVALYGTTEYSRAAPGGM